MIYLFGSGKSEKWLYLKFENAVSYSKENTNENMSCLILVIAIQQNFRLVQIQPI